MNRVGLLAEGGTDEIILQPLIRRAIQAKLRTPPMNFGFLPLPFSPNGFGEIPKNLRMLLKLYYEPSERSRIECDLYVVVHDSRKTEVLQQEIRQILKDAPEFPSVYGLAVQETEAWVLGDIENVNRHVFRISPLPRLPRPPEKDPDPKATLTTLFVRPSSDIEFDRWNQECARLVAPHLRVDKVHDHCRKGFGRFLKALHVRLRGHRQRGSE
ncbi:MAG: DUF4276 family protein [Planctomycetales bacterium]|nr:DUF4276 family protein [Planctomycetales bacterium]